ncbi:hypothetical protein [Maritimibacter dapengensis]|uniref:Lipoprotein n=1 Tax=Maritimibacter dapengensis TaxID=2836868 RepID=A0ABS6T1K0_9RHOB|nr:hypothetical protein [Maritimibacter dapengensis]
MSTKLAYPVAALAALAGCAEQAEVSRAVASAEAATTPFTPEYLGIDTRLLDGDLVAFDVKMTGARGNQDVADYAQCAASQYALIRGYGFARHVRTAVDRRGPVWEGDATYVISDALPEGLAKIDAEVAVAACEENGIPTI